MCSFCFFFISGGEIRLAANSRVLGIVINKFIKKIYLRKVTMHPRMHIRKVLRDGSGFWVEDCGGMAGGWLMLVAVSGMMEWLQFGLLCAGHDEYSLMLQIN